MLRHALNAAISMDSGAPAAHELLLANPLKSVIVSQESNFSSAYALDELACKVTLFLQ
jgi:hypothetical protein